MNGLAYRHQRVQRLRRLVGRRSARQEEGRFVLEGVNLLEEALRSRARIEAVFVDGDWARSGHQRKPERIEDGPAPLEEGRPDTPGTGTPGTGTPGTGTPGTGTPNTGTPGTGTPNTGTPGTGTPGTGTPNAERLGTLLRQCYDLGTRVFELEPGVLARVAGTVTPQPVMAIVETPAVELADVLGASPRLIVVCIDVRDPGNAGTVVRSAWAAGADAVVSCDGTVDLWNPKAVRASAGAVLHLPVVAAGPAVPALDAIGAEGLQRLGAGSRGWSRLRGAGPDTAERAGAGQRSGRPGGARAAPATRRPCEHPHAGWRRIAQRRDGGRGAVLRSGPPASLWAPAVVPAPVGSGGEIRPGV